MEVSLASTPTNRVVSRASFFQKQWASWAGRMSLLPSPFPHLVTVLRTQCRALLHEILLTQGSAPLFLMSPALVGRFFTTSATWEAPGESLGDALFVRKGFLKEGKEKFASEEQRVRERNGIWQLSSRLTPSIITRKDRSVSGFCQNPFSMGLKIKF